DPSATLAGVAMGTPAFMPPEQASARWDDVDAQSDLWSLGATMFTMLTGRYVHEGGTVNESLALAVTQDAPSLADVVSDVPPPIVEIVDRALRRNKAERWASAAEMQMAIRIAYRELQGDVPEGERYSLSQGRVRQHSIPPRTMLSDSPLGSLSSSSLTEDPVSASIADLKRNPHQKRWVLGGVGLGAFVVLALLFSGGSKPAPSAGAQGPAPIAAPPPNVVTEKLSPEVEPRPVEKAPAPADSAETLAADSAVQGQNGDVRPNRAKRSKPGSAPVGTSPVAAPEREHRPPAPKPAAHDVPFDPFSRRD